MVVFGAGASYDSAAAFPDNEPLTWRPPIANELFDMRRFGRYVAQFPKLRAFIKNLQPPADVEQTLTKYQDESSTDDERVRQLAAVRYYLQGMLSDCLNGWRGEIHGATNYNAFMDQVRHRRKAGERVCLVTFNYDTLLEEAVSEIASPISAITDYISGEYQVIKLHGSINWAHDILPYRNVTNHHPGSVVNQVIQDVPKLKFSPDYHVIPAQPLTQRYLENAQFPALAIPIANKSSYVCPEAHHQMLVECLPKVEKLLIIGWRGADDSFLKLLAENIGARSRIMVVSSSQAKASQIILRIRNSGVNGSTFTAAEAGFGQTITNGEFERFLEA